MRTDVWLELCEESGGTAADVIVEALVCVHCLAKGIIANVRLDLGKQTLDESFSC